MELDACKKKIDRYLSKDNVQPLIVDVKNSKGLSEIIMHYDVGTNKIISASEYCNTDELPRKYILFDFLSRTEDTIFITGLTSFFKLLGEQELQKGLKEILSMTTVGHVVVVSYQCSKYLNYLDHRLSRQIVLLDGAEQQVPEIIFTEQPLLMPGNITPIEGIHNFADAVESASGNKVYIVTEKKRELYPYALYQIMGLYKAYDALVQKDSATLELKEEFGTEKQWQYALKLFDKKDSWGYVIDEVFGGHVALEYVAPSYTGFDIYRQWLYYIALKLYGAKNNWCLDDAAARSDSFNDFIRRIYRGILDVNISDKSFWMKYSSRKKLLNQFNNPSNEVNNYCKVVTGKGKIALYYLTDNTQRERETIFEILDQYGLEYDRNELIGILQKVYPALYEYLQPYRFKNEFLDKYFQDYKYQKVINKLLPEFKAIVDEQAVKRDYNLFLEPRSSKIEALKRGNVQLYFIDAMGAEYLGYILSVCRQLNLIANVTVCCSELPSITSKNKEFLELFDGGAHPVISVKELDEIKHHGKDSYDYYKGSKLPIYLMRELEIIQEVLGKIKDKLEDGVIERAIMIADHGASRLAVLYDKENLWEMSEQGKHSGRCCLKNICDVQPDFATDAGEFWSLANYDRFKGGRKANVEVHGGAAIEEVCVPIIELVYNDQDIEVYLMLVDEDVVEFDKVPEIDVSYRKKAALKIFSTALLSKVGISVNGNYYDATDMGNKYYRIDMPDLKKPGTYYADIYSGDNLLARKLPFIIRKEGSQVKDLL